MKGQNKMCNNCKRALKYSSGEDTADLMNSVASYLLSNGFIETPEGCGAQEISSANCDFEIRIIKKREKKSK